MSQWKKVQKDTLIWMASLACFTGGIGDLSAVSYYANVGGEPGDVDSSCTTCNSNTNTCCTFLDALNGLGAFSSPGPTAGIVVLTGIPGDNPHTVIYENADGSTATLNANYITVYGNPLTINGGDGGGVIDFNGVETSNGSNVDFAIGAGITLILEGTVFQNTTSNGNVIFNSGTLEMNGTLANYNATSSFFENVAWEMGLTNETVNVVFAAPGGHSNYSVAFPGDIAIGAGQTNTILNMQNTSGDTVTVSGAITADSGCSFTINATDELIFTGSISSEVVTTTAGTVEISGTLLVPNDMTLTSDTSTTTNITGSVSGSNGTTLTIAGSGTASISTIDVPTLSLASYFIVEGIIGGTSSLTKTGPGVAILESTSTYTGDTYVNEGVLIVNGNITDSADLIVASGALLSGTGNVGPTDVSGIIKGGNTLGTLTVNGDLTLESGSHFGTLITSTNTSLIDVTTDVTINSGADYLVVFEPGTYDSVERLVLSAGSITGTFDTINSGGIGPYFLSAVLHYTSTTVILGLDQRSIVSLATGGNAIQVAEALDAAIAFNRTNISYTISGGSSSPAPQATVESDVTIIPSGTPELADVLISLLPFTTEESMTYALNQLQPAHLKGMAIVQENNAVRVRESLSQRIFNEINAENCSLYDTPDANGAKDEKSCKKNKKMMTAWASGLGDTLEQNNHSNYWGPLAGYRANTGGAIGGFDVMFADYFYAGAIGAYTNSNLNFKEGKGSGSISTGYTGLDFSVVGAGDVGKMFYANTAVVGGWSQYCAERRIVYSGTNLAAKSSHGGRQLLSHLDTGLNINCIGVTIRPFDSFDYITQVENKYSEHNAGEWELTIGRKNAMMIRNELGLQFSTCYCFSSSKWIFAPKLSWVREIRLKGDSFNVNFTQGGTPFLTEGYFPDRSLIAPGLAITGMMLKDALMFDLYYNGEFGSGYSSNSVGGQVGYSF